MVALGWGMPTVHRLASVSGEPRRATMKAHLSKGGASAPTHHPHNPRTTDGDLLFLGCCLSGDKVALAVDNIELLNGNLCANLGHLGRDLLSFLLGNSLFNRPGSLVNDRFSFFQAQACNLTYNFDDVDLVGTNF
jgi:hypothetical protein